MAATIKEIPFDFPASWLVSERCRQKKLLSGQQLELTMRRISSWCRSPSVFRRFAAAATLLSVLLTMIQEGHRQVAGFVPAGRPFYATPSSRAAPNFLLSLLRSDSRRSPSRADASTKTKASSSPSTPSSSSITPTQNQQQSYNVKVSYEGRTCSVDINEGESVLNAMERSPEVARRLGLPGGGMPSDCRRGNCMTCSAVHRDDSETGNLKQGGNGLTPAVSKRMLASPTAASSAPPPQQQYVLTCSSYVEGEGVHLELGECDSAWIEAYKASLESDETRRIARESVARAIRKGAERNVGEWAERTEEVLRKTPRAE